MFVSSTIIKKVPIVKRFYFSVTQDAVLTEKWFCTVSFLFAMEENKMKQHSRYQTARHLLIFWTLFLVHHQNIRYENAAQEMDALLGINHTRLRSIRCREGVFRRV